MSDKSPVTIAQGVAGTVAGVGQSQIPKLNLGEPVKVWETIPEGVIMEASAAAAMAATAEAAGETVVAVPNKVKKTKTPKVPKAITDLPAEAKTQSEILMGVSTAPLPISLPPALHARLLKPVTGEGGWQSLMTDLRAVTASDAPIAFVSPDLLLRMVPKAVVHGSGGYQGVIRWVLCLILEQHAATVLNNYAMFQGGK